MTVVAVIQARMGSSRLPGKMMLPLDGIPTIQHIVRRTRAASNINDVVVATSDRKADDILVRYASRVGADVYRGSESDVLGRLYEAAAGYDPTTVVRMCGDRPLIPPSVIDATVEKRAAAGVEYASNMDNRTFPVGLGSEAFTFSSFKEVEQRSEEPYQREHVTPLYRDAPEQFETVDLTAGEVFERSRFHERSDLRLTLDEADDYELLRTVYANVEYDNIVDFREAVEYIDNEGLQEMNAGVAQKSVGADK